MEASDLGPWVGLRGESVLGEPWPRRVRELKSGQQVDRIRPLLTSRKPVYHSASSGQVTEEGVQKNVQVAPMSHHPLEDSVKNFPPRQSRSAPPFLPSIVVRSQEGAGTSLVFRNPETVGGLLERLGMFILELGIRPSKVGEPAFQSERHWGKSDLRNHPRL